MPKKVATKDDWIKLGFTLFSESGEQGLVVDKMSRLLNCNKSSFYHHFKTKSDFIENLVGFWIEKDTKGIIHEVMKEITPKEKFIKLTEIAFKKDSNLDFNFYLKKYAQSKDPIKKLVDKIDKERIKFVSDLLVAMDTPKDSAMAKAKLYYKYLIGYHEMIRYKRQNKNYLTAVLEELNQFIKI